jgi:hypothetical protein
MKLKELAMLEPTITYELAKEIHRDRLKKAEAARLIEELRAAPEPAQPQKWPWRFSLKGSLTALLSKIGRPRRLRLPSNG